MAATRNAGRQSLSQQATRWVGRYLSRSEAIMSRKPRTALLGGSVSEERWSGTP